ncbi:hypothetical protein H4R18_001712 [Coemansia javaensis]|uniref:tRNA (guanine-N(7)-)-methyltransferase non-catalytic subunit n=1 Tax=Coemansia javaensis TaxID=2761396 RepID=A0A9W8HEU7_9FUNG|nr:hypothetical protein H4R18_001712 [Coemansia javaensis]
MPRLPITLMASSPAGLAMLAFDADFHIVDRTGKVVASTTVEADGVARISRAGKGAVKAAAFSRDAGLFAACTSEKEMAIYSTGDWALVRSHVAEKRVNAIAFDPQGAFLVTADKFGDAHRVPAAAAEGAAELLLGHVSILCDVAFSYGPRPLVLTCDRDEKLRISRYPNAYNIEAFGLGHTEFVTSVATAQFAPDVAVTGAGDGTVRLWDVATGRLLQTVRLEGLLAGYYADGRAARGENSYVDRTAAAERYGVLRVRAAEGLRAFVAVVERIPAVVVLPLGDGPALGPASVVDVASPPTDVAVLGDRVVVSYAPGPGGDLAVALSWSGGTAAADEALSSALNALPTGEADAVAPVPSIFVWGSKTHLDRPAGDDEDGE